MDEFPALLSAVIVFHGYIQPLEAKWRGKSFLRYRIYLIPEAVHLTDAINFTYVNRITIAAK